jgi:chorismate mutase/prephenate dehydratase
MSLDELRDRIDALDRQILDLLLERARTAQEIGRIKTDNERATYSPAREASLLQELLARDLSPLDADAVSSIFREIVSVCRALQRRLKIAYLGPEHTFTHVAAQKHFGQSCDFLGQVSIHDVFLAVERRHADFGVVPIQNSTEGVVGDTLDCLLDTGLHICAELYVPVHHFLLARCPLDEIRAVNSHPQVLAQCRQWLRETLPGVEQIPTSSTSTGAMAAAHEDGLAAIAPRQAAAAHSLDILAENIEDLPSNRTRFFVVGDLEAPPTGSDKTSLVFSTPHRAGALHRALTAFAEHGINLTLIQSRPARGKLWEYVFFVDFEGHADDQAPDRALTQLRDYCALLKILGSYPAQQAAL